MSTLVPHQITPLFSCDVGQDRSRGLLPLAILTWALTMAPRDTEVYCLKIGKRVVTARDGV